MGGTLLSIHYLSGVVDLLLIHVLSRVRVLLTNGRWLDGRLRTKAQRGRLAPSPASPEPVGGSPVTLAANFKNYTIYLYIVCTCRYIPYSCLCALVVLGFFFLNSRQVYIPLCVCNYRSAVSRVKIRSVGDPFPALLREYIVYLYLSLSIYLSIHISLLESCIHDLCMAWIFKVCRHQDLSPSIKQSLINSIHSRSEPHYMSLL